MSYNKTVLTAEQTHYIIIFVKLENKVIGILSKHKTESKLFNRMLI